MKIAVLSAKEVGHQYAGNLLQRGHSVVMWGGGMLHKYALMPYLECDGALLLNDEDEDLRTIADFMKAAGKPIWYELSDVPK